MRPSISIEQRSEALREVFYKPPAPSSPAALTHRGLISLRASKSLVPRSLHLRFRYDYYEQEQQQGNRNAWSATMRHFVHCERNDLSRCKLYFEQEMKEKDWIESTHATLSPRAKHENYLKSKRLTVSDF